MVMVLILPCFWGAGKVWGLTFPYKLETLVPAFLDSLAAQKEKGEPAIGSPFKEES